LKAVEEKVKRLGLSEIHTLAEIQMSRQDFEELLKNTDPSIPENRSVIERFLGSKKALEQTMRWYGRAGRRLTEAGSLATQVRQHDALELLLE
jgi:hypothetical protein